MIVESAHFEYLAIQRGEVSDQRHDFSAWKRAYERSLLTIFESIKPALPTKCTSVLDVGSGLGGIDVLLARHYGSLDVVLLDGLDCPAEVRLHREPFSNAEVALDFQRKNGNSCVHCCFPAPPPGTFDLIVSFAAWCFHIAPSEYLPAVRQAMHDTTVLIVDVRKRSDWLDELRTALGSPVAILRSEAKYTRMAFRCSRPS